MKIKNIFYAMAHLRKYAEFVRYKSAVRKELRQLDSDLVEILDKTGKNLGTLSTSIADLEHEIRTTSLESRQTGVQLDKAEQRLINFGSYLDEVESQANKSYERAVRR